MKNKFTVLLFCLAILNNISIAASEKLQLSYTVSMEQPNTHYFHVVFRCEGLKGESQDFKIPAWTPGYYKIMDFAKNVLNFRAEDGEGKAMKWEKTAKNIWRVYHSKTGKTVISYDVYAFRQSVADSYLDDSRAYISPTGVFMHVAGQLQNSLSVTIKPHKNFSKISTGLDRVRSMPNTFSAKDFDVLYDCPIFIGNQEIISFDIQGIPHTAAIFEPGNFDREKFVSTMKKMIESAVAVVGEIPYRHYTFIMMGEGQGGLEHLNSMAVFSKVPNFEDKQDYSRWLSFIAHEYFHLYNVKAIRPVALGPFDYDKENYTDILWFSEGGTVYYEYLILNRAGLMSRNEVLEHLKNSIVNYEKIPGRLFQSATDSSFDIWLNFLNWGGTANNTTISYYDKGCALTMLLDLKIRFESKNKKSLDDVMKILYQKFYKEQNRGFTDKEFRQVCEDVAGRPLNELFDEYISTVKEIDYKKYFAYAGLNIDSETNETAGAFLGATADDQSGKLIIQQIEWNSPAQQSGLSIQDEIVVIDGNRANLRSLNETLKSKKAGEKIQVQISRRNKISSFEVTLGKKTERTFDIKPMENPTKLQSEILQTWLKE